jgi:ribonuclease HI
MMAPPADGKPAPGRSGYVLVFDGGSHGNPGPAYGSFRIQCVGRPADAPERLTLGRGTNNEAEYKTLIAGLEALQGHIHADGKAPGDVEVEVRGDSLLVIEQLRGRWKVRDGRMRRLNEQAAKLLSPFGRVRLVHQPRRASVRILGH